MDSMKFYIWDDSVIVVAASIEEARKLAAERLSELSAAKEMVRHERPLELETP